MDTIERIKERMHLAAQNYRRQREAERENAQALAEMDDLLDAIRPAMDENARKHRERDAKRAANLRLLALRGWGIIG